MKKLDKKQVPQFAALCILSAGLFGYFVVRLVTPSPAAAGTLPKPVTQAAGTAAPTSQAAGAPTPGSAPTAATATALTPAEAAVPPPTPGMRDPFVISAIDTKAPPAAPVAAPKPLPPATKIASLPALRPAPIPGAPALPPSLRGFSIRAHDTVSAPPAPALPPAHTAPDLPPAPTWTVTGVLQGETDKVAILRNGEARRIVRTGDFVDSLYRVVDVTRTTVTLRHGPTFYHLTLGVGSTAPAPAATAPAPHAAPTAPAVPGPKDAASAPADPPQRPLLSLAHAGRSLILRAGSYLAPADTTPTPPAASHIRVTNMAQVAMRFLDDQTPMTGLDDARARLEMGVALYQKGQCLQGRAEWQHVLGMDDLDAADEAGKLLYRYP